MTLSEILASSSGTAIIILTMIQILPIKIYPWKFIGKVIGRAINGEVLEKVEQLDKKVDAIDKRQTKAEDIHNASDADQCRTRIIRFSDEIRRNVNHSEEFFNEILSDITNYEKYCTNHKDYKNSKANNAIYLIQNTYQMCVKENSFL